MLSGGGSSGIGRASGMASVFADIKNGGSAKLKKVGLPNNNKKKQIQKTGLGGKISLKDILKAKGTLNKTGSKW